MRGWAAVWCISLLLTFSGCTSDAEPNASTDPLGGPDDPEAASPRAPDGEMTGSTAKTAILIDPWQNQTRIAIFDAEVPITTCLPSADQDLCAYTPTPDLAIPPGTQALEIRAEGFDGPLSLSLRTNRGLELHGDLSPNPPYNWTLSLPSVKNQLQWNLPDHAQSGVHVRAASPTPQPPATGVSLHVVALRQAEWSPMALPDAYANEALPSLEAGMLLAVETSVTAESTAGHQRQGALVPLPAGTYIPVGTFDVVVVTRWSPSPDCPPEHRCVALPDTGSAEARETVGSPQRAGENWRIDVVAPNVQTHYLWTELPNEVSGNSFRIHAVACSPISESCVGHHPHYTSTFSLDTTIAIELWNQTADLDSVVARYGLA